MSHLVVVEDFIYSNFGFDAYYSFCQLNRINVIATVNKDLSNSML